MPLKIAVIGAGSMGTNHLRVLKEFPGEQVQLIGVAEPHESSLKTAVSRFHIPGFSDYRTMIAETQPDLVAIVVPTELHYEVAAFALEAGVNVLIEKPVTSTIRQAEALIELAIARGKRIAVGHVERFNPAIIELKRQLKTGRLGRLYYMHSRRIGPFPARIRDVGVVLDLATHDLDIMRYLSDAEVERVFAESQQRIHQSHEDLILGLIRFANDVVGMLDVNWLTPTKMREISVTGERGMFLANYLTQDLFFYENDYTETDWDVMRSMAGVSEGTMTRLKVQKAEPLRLEYENIIAALHDEADLVVTGEDGLAVLRIAYQLVEAAQAAQRGANIWMPGIVSTSMTETPLQLP